MTILLRVIFRLAALSCILVSLSSSAQVVKQTLYFDMDEEGGWVPFLTAAEPGKPGIMNEITEALQRHSTIKFIPIKLPQKRAKFALKEGSVDFDFICLEWLKNGVVGSEYVTSEPFFELTENFITLKKNATLFPTRESFNQQRVGTIAGYFYFDDHTFIRTNFLNENQLMSGLKHERFKVIILEQETAKHWAKVNDVDIHLAALHSKGHFLIRLSKKYAPLLPMLNEAIRKIKASGELQAILDKHNTQVNIS
jgi:hypothetical protein